MLARDVLGDKLNGKVWGTSGTGAWQSVVIRTFRGLGCCFSRGGELDHSCICAQGSPLARLRESLAVFTHVSSQQPENLHKGMNTSVLRSELAALGRADRLRQHPWV